MIDIDLIRKDSERVRRALAKRVPDIDLAPILDLDQQRRTLIKGLDDRRSQRKQLSERIGRARGTGEDTTALQSEASAMRDEITRMEADLGGVEDQLNERLSTLPNLPDEHVPAGGKENNQVVRTFGEKPNLPAKPLDHVEICKRLGLVDFERGTKLGGTGFWIYTGMGAALEWALIDFFCREHIRDGYEFVLPPHLLVDECGYAAGQFPKFRDDVFHLQTSGNERKRFLLPTSETAILNIYRDEIIPFDKLPIKMFAYSPCYRRESGGYRSEERGTVRGHQFNKVEMFQFVSEENAETALQELVGKTERLVEKLGLHHRTSLLAAEDASASMAVTYDVEVWMPSIGMYKEVSSASLARDYQARRANIRTHRAGRKATEYIHTLNASGLATSRVFPAMLEQCQQEDGSLLVPEVLRPWVGTDVIRPAK
ncbi:MAG TPA: serine--tRNA ligase [Thermoanaerobaculia bacterium]|nr:serine--tRNA ligase [Thermoanaerobaculia bacterium]